MGGNDANAMKTSAMADVTGDQGQADQARARRSGSPKSLSLSIEDARTKVNQYQQQYQQTVDQAKKAIQAADTAATVVSRGALFGFVALLLAALAGWFGGRSGKEEPTLTETVVDTRVRS